MRALVLCLGCALIAIGALAPTAFAQKCNSSTMDDAPTSRYQLASNGTATDTQTGLMWARCALGETWNAKSSTCSGSAGSYTWQDALQAIQSLDQGGGYAGYNDWRLPNLRELMSITRYHCSAPAINLTVFPNTDTEAFWSSTPLESSVGQVWTLDFDTGQAAFDDMSAQDLVRPVRAGAFDNALPPPGSSAAAAVINYRPR